MARTTISIPDDLKKRMDRIKGPVNWSAVAVAAFEQRLVEIAATIRQQHVTEAAQMLKRTKLPTSTEMKDAERLRSLLIDQIEYQADWRERKAVEYPDDLRNKNSAMELRSLAGHLDKLPPNDALWVRYWRVWRHDAVDLSTLVEYESEKLRTFGFSNGETQEDIGHETAVVFLKQLVDGLEEIVLEEIVGKTPS